jgi:hypothetical protein
MNTNTHISLNDTDLQGRFTSWLKTVLFLIAPKHLRLIAGHAAGKTADSSAERSRKVLSDMPKSYHVLVSDTYVNCLKNIVLPYLKD